METEVASKPSASLNTIESMTYSRNEKPFGKTWEEWTAKWWQWLVSIPKTSNPGLDTREQVFTAEQSDLNVIFLVGNYGGRSQRRYVIPSEKAVLFPIINFQTSFTEEPHLKTEDDLRSRARRDMDDIVKKEAKIDGLVLKNVEGYRVQSDVFDINYPENNALGLRPGPTRAVSDGFWVFLKPLNPGEHVIHSIGACSLGETMVECTWLISVV